MVLAGLQGAAEPAPLPGFAGANTWALDHADFGGLSGVEVARDGLSLIALSDKGRIVTATITRDAKGQVTGLSDEIILPLLDNRGRPLQDGRSDSEGLAVADDGRLFVSFETPGRVVEYPALGMAGKALPKHPDFSRMKVNAALESLAIDATGTVYTLEEAKADSTGHLILYRFRHDTWDDNLRLPQDENFLPVGADIGPDGRYYLLDRQFSPPAGFASRLRRFDLGETGVSGETLLMQSATGQFDNLEGLSVWRDPQGRLVATMVSDDNFLFLLRTELVEFHLPD